MCVYLPRKVSFAKHVFDLIKDKISHKSNFHSRRDLINVSTLITSIQKAYTRVKPYMENTSTLLEIQGYTCPCVFLVRSGFLRDIIFNIYTFHHISRGVKGKGKDYLK